MKTLPLASRFPFLVLEGGDGSGKTSVRQHIFRQMRFHGVVPLSTITTSWLLPDATELITKAKYGGMQFSSGRIVDAYVRDKEEFTRRQLLKQLPFRPCVVDRFIHSDIANNEVIFGIARDEMINAYDRSAVLEPDIIIWLDTPPEVAVDRLSKRVGRQRHSWEHLTEQRRLHSTFVDLLQSNPLQLKSTVARLDNSGSLAETLEQLEGMVIQPLLPTLSN
jgi:dTMP kinase